MAAEEQLTALVNEGYVVLDSIKKDYLNKERINLLIPMLISRYTKNNLMIGVDEYNLG